MAVRLRAGAVALRQVRRCFVTSVSLQSAGTPSTHILASDAYTKDSATPTERIGHVAKLLRWLSPEDRDAVSSMLRVDHSGEIAANTIYEAQADVFGAQGKPRDKELIHDMWENEKKHLLATRNMLDAYRVRPSALTPVWAMAGRVLGGATALLGPKSAMACTEAVETVIGEHYDE